MLRESVFGFDKKLNETITINNEGKGETIFTIPESWKDYGDPCVVRKYYLEEKESGAEFPRAYYVANPNKTEEENKKNSKRIRALMLKVAKDDVRDGFEESVNAVILGEELNSEEKKDNKCSRCEEEITLKHIENLFGVLSKHKAFRQEIVDNINKYVKQRKDEGKPIHLNTCLRKAHFFAQVGAETLGIHPDWMVETDVYPYAVKNIKQSLFGNRALNLKASGNLETYCEERPQKKLLNYLYAKENGLGNGNGNEASGDGYKFRGRGLKQLTGRGNYKKATTFLKDIFPKEYIDLEANPDKVKEAKYAVLSAIAYWEKNAVWQTADQVKEVTDQNVKRVRRKINGGTAGWKDVKRFLEKGFEVFKVNECTIVSSNVDSCEKCKKGHKDLADASKWVSQFTLERPNVACQRACLQVLYNYGLLVGSGSRGGNDSNIIQTVLEENDKLVVKNAKEGVDYLDTQINTGYPVLVGVDHTLRKDKTKNKDINELTTDHFIVIVGRGCDEGKIYYRFFEVGTKHSSKGINEGNKLYLQNNNTIVGKSPGKTKTYTITQVRKNKH